VRIRLFDATGLQSYFVEFGLPFTVERKERTRTELSRDGRQYFCLIGRQQPIRLSLMRGY
jgi:hypothetical protein